MASLPVVSGLDTIRPLNERDSSAHGGRAATSLS